AIISFLCSKGVMFLARSSCLDSNPTKLIISKTLSLAFISCSWNFLLCRTFCKKLVCIFEYSPYRIFSLTDKSFNMLVIWKVLDIFKLAILYGAILVIFSFLKRIFPSVAFKYPVIMLNIVVFPEPLGPVFLIISFFFIFTLTLFLVYYIPH